MRNQENSKNFNQMDDKIAIATLYRIANTNR